MNKNIILVFTFICLSSCVPQLQYYSLNQGDKNENGVRDDIEEYINQTYEDQDLRNALYQYSHDLWMNMTPRVSKEEYYLTYKLKLKSNSCVLFIVSGHDLGQKASKIRTDLFARHINTLSNWWRYRRSLDLMSAYQPGHLSDNRTTEMMKDPTSMCRFKLEDKKKSIERFKSAHPEYFK